MFEASMILVFSLFGSLLLWSVIPKRRSVFARMGGSSQHSQLARRVAKTYIVFSVFVLCVIAFYQVYNASIAFAFEF